MRLRGTLREIRYTVQHILRIPDLCMKADSMPTVPNIPGPYRVFFYSFDCQEPPHVHVQRERMVCKFWLTPVALSVNHGFSPPGAEPDPRDDSGAAGPHFGGMA